MQRLLLSLVLIFFTAFCFASESVELDLESGITMSLTQYQGEGKTLLLWLPSERGFGQSFDSIASGLSAIKYDVWAANLHDSYVVPTGNQSLDEVDISDLVELIAFAQKQGFKQVYLISSSRSMELALKTGYLWQQQNENSRFIKGLLSFSPHLIKGGVEMGQDASYVEIASHSNLPVYLLQAQYSTKYARNLEITHKLQQGGSPVYIHSLRGIQGGFHMRPNEDLTERDLAMRKQLPQIIKHAIDLLRLTEPATFNAGLELAAMDVDTGETTVSEPQLQPFHGNKTPPSLVLKNLSDQLFDLTELKGNAVLINFWATWCGPCVEEMPSLTRLAEGMKGRPFKVIAVNIGESAEDVKRFTRLIPVNFEILLDKEGKAVRDWKVYAYPSNYLLDSSGKIQFAYRGALKWDSPSIIKTIEELL